MKYADDEAELAYAGTLLYGAAPSPLVADADIGNPLARAVHRAARRALASGAKETDLAVLAEELRREAPDLAGDAPALMETVRGPGNRDYWARRVRRYADARSVRLVAEEALAATDPDPDRQREALGRALEALALSRDESRVGLLSEWPWRTAEEIRVAEDTQRDWIVPNLLARREATLWFGKPKVGKTDALLGAILAPLSRGEGVLGHPAPPEQVLCVILSEESPGRWRSHVERFDLRGAQILTRGTIPPGTAWETVTDTSARYAASVGASIVVVDTLAAHAGLDGEGAENDTGKTGAAVRPMLEAAARHNVAFVAVHHVRKWSDGVDPANVDLIRGSGNIGASFDVLVHVCKPSNAPDRFRRRELHVGGRLDTEPFAVLMEKDPGFGRRTDVYRVLDAAESTRDPDLERAILDALGDQGPMNLAALVSEVERRRADVAASLKHLAAGGRVRVLPKRERPEGVKGKVFALLGPSPGHDA